MLKRYIKALRIFTCLSCLLFFNHRSQATNTDSLLIQLKQSKNDTSVLRKYFDLSETCETSQIMYFVRPGIKICAQKLSDPNLSETERNAIIKIMAGLTNNAGFYYDGNGLILKSIRFFEQALSLYQSIDDRKGEATTLNNLGSMYYLQGDLNTAIDYYFKSLQIKERINYKKGLGNTCQNIADIYFDLGNIAKATEYTLKGLAY